ncbi:MAG: efflux RND transporter periplasmic adaptor subunit [Candidatus Eremiobacteraeota bacterium]|nr:efflux RND transporter periplasmic adaptor subunit [Candidatus Eremiobacteraeota bacterium]
MRYFALILVATIVIGAGCSQAPKVATPEPSPTQAPSGGQIKLTTEQYKNGGFQTAAAGREVVSQSFQALGEFKTKNNARSSVEAPLPGRVLSLLVEEGDSVVAGQPVVTIESPELSRLLAEHHHAQRKLELLEANAGSKMLLVEQGAENRAPLNQARTRLQQARAQLQSADAHLKQSSQQKERLEKLISVGIPSQQQVEQAQADYLQALAAYQAAQDELKLAQESFQSESILSQSEARSAVGKREISAELQLAREELRHQAELLEVLGKETSEENPRITLRAPAAGSVTSIAGRVGEYVETGQSLLQIVRSGDVYPVIWIPGSKVPEVQIGTPVQVFFSTDSPGYPAKISWLAPEIDGESRTLEARLELEDKDLSARSGIFLKADVQTRKHESLVVPKSALTEVNDMTCVYVANGQLTFQRREVEVGVQSGDSAEILKGLEAGEECAVKGVFLLKSYDLGTEGE